jgi:CRP/FNR family transcriptional regulator, cyclic AMP receptor protein
MRESLLARLRHHPFVSEFDVRHVEKLATLGREVRFDRDHIIFREGDETSEFYLLVTGLVALEIAAPGHTFRVQTLFAGDELGWSALLMGRGKHFQARTLERVDALAFEGEELLAACREDTAFGFAFTLRLLAVVAGRLQATRLQVLDMYSPVAARAGA